MYLEDIRAYAPQSEQEEADRRIILAWAERLGDAVLTRESESAHLTASGLVLNGSRTKVLMARHDLYRVWAWTGGHADGDGDLLSVALREAREEPPFRRFVLPALALCSGLFMVIAGILSYQWDCLYYLLFFAVFMAAGALFYKRKSL